VQASRIDREDPGIATAGRPEGARPKADKPAVAPDGAGFRTLLRRRSSGRDGGNARGAGSEAALEGLRPLLPLAAPAREVSVRAVAPRPEVARVLVGQAHAAQEARIELRGGLLAGSSIRLVTTANGVEARLGAPTEAARLALTSVIDRVGLHLRSRGIVMRPGAPLDTGSRQSERDQRQKG
jgi:hypothetical protein